MSDSLNPVVDRRTFIRGAAGVVGATALANSGFAALAPGEGLVSIAFFDGNRLIPAERMGAGDRTIRRAEIMIDSRGRGSLRGLNVNFPVRVSKTVRKYPFKAWESGGSRRRFEVPVDAKAGIGMTVTQGSAKAEQRTEFSLGLTGGGPALREGTYVIAAGRVNWSSFRFEPEQDNGPLLAAGGRPTSLQYVVVTVGRI